MTSSNILVTGGAGYIGSHTVVALAAAGYAPVIFDNFGNAHPGVVDRLKRLTGQDIPVVRGDCRDAAGLQVVFETHDIDAVVHFAGLKAVGESVAKPILYYDNNVGGWTTLLSVAQANGVGRFILSSSATVYAPLDNTLISETAPLGPTNPYGQSKLICEQIGTDLCQAEPDVGVALLRYFNPIGAHPSGQIGEAPNDVPQNLLPYVAMVANGRLPQLTVHGNDYDTPDGTGVRDYLHVMDLARGHVQALDHLSEQTGCHVFNLGTGRGTSVLELVADYEKTSGKSVPYKIGPRRAGDQVSVVADPSRANRVLDFRCDYSISDACRDAQLWMAQNPNGYED